MDGVTIQDFADRMRRRQDGLGLRPPTWDRGIDWAHVELVPNDRLKELQKASGL